MAKVKFKGKANSVVINETGSKHKEFKRNSKGIKNRGLLTGKTKQWHRSEGHRVSSIESQKFGPFGGDWS